MPLTTLIVDDEPLARAGLRLLLAGDPDVSAIGEASNGRDAVDLIRNQRPDLVFLDVQMPEMDGFAVLQEVGATQMPAVVFVTAHDQYATRAFDINAVDYLLKPVTRDRFAQALARAKARLPITEDSVRQMTALLELLASPNRYVKRLAVRSAKKTSFVAVEEIDWIQAAENYVELHLGHSSGRASHLLLVTMNTLEAALDPAMFLRIHRSMIVNVQRIRELEPASHGEYVIHLESGTRLQSGRTYHDRIRALTANPF
jgi:two-component system LytT family response regulator